MKNLNNALSSKVFAEGNASIPRLRFKGFTGEWKECKFSDLYIYASEGGTPNTNIKEYYNGNIPFVKIEDTVNKYIYSTVSYISELGLENSSAWLVPSDSIIFTNGATVGNVAINKKIVTTKQGILGIIPKKSLDIEFIFYLLSTQEFQKNLVAKQASGTFATIILRNLNDIKVIIPANIEQKKIGGLFQKLDKLITLQKEKIDTIKNLKNAFLNKIFPENNETIPRLRFQGFTGEWKECKYKELGIALSGGALSYENLSTNGINKCILYGELYTQYDCIIKNIKNTTNNLGLTVYKNDILFPQSTTVDALSLISPACMNEDKAETSGVFVIRPYKHINGNFIAYFTKGNINQRVKLSKKAQGLTIIHLYFQSIRDETILIPTFAEQNKIGQFFQKLDKLIALYEQKHEKLKILKKAMLKQIFVA